MHLHVGHFLDAFQTWKVNQSISFRKKLKLKEKNVGDCKQSAKYDIRKPLGIINHVRLPHWSMQKYKELKYIVGCEGQIKVKCRTLLSFSLSVTRCEEGVSVEQFQPVEELLALIASFTLFGKNELKVALCVTNPQPPGFTFDPPLTKGKLSCALCVALWEPPHRFTPLPHHQHPATLIIRCRPFEIYYRLITQTAVAQQM